MNFINWRSKSREGERGALLSFSFAHCWLSYAYTEEKRGELSRYAFLPNFNRLFCHESLRGVPMLFFIGRRLDLVDNCYNNV